MTDRTAAGINNQKRSVSVLVVPLVEADVLTTGSTYVNLPARSLVVAVGINVKTASGTTGAELDVTLGGTDIATDVDIDDTGWKVGTLAEDAAYAATGGVIGVNAGTTTPADGAFVGDLVVQYIELDKTNGEYTN